MKKLSLHTRIHYLQCKSFGLGFLYSITKNRLFFDKKIRTGIVLIALMNMLAGCGNRGSELKTNSKQDTLSKKSSQNDSISNTLNSRQNTEISITTCYFTLPMDTTRYIANSETDSLKKGDQNYIYAIAEEMPMFSGEINDFIKSNLIYPQCALQEGIFGKVITQIIIEKDGSISNITIVKSIDPELDQEAIRLIQSMPKWIPGKQHNVPVRVKYTLPVMFNLPDKQPL